MKTFGQTRWLFAVLVCLALEVHAQQLITNGGFESGFGGWTRLDQVGSESTWLLQSGTGSPVNGFTVPAPPGGGNAAMTDAQGPGSHVLYQNFTVPLTMSVASFQFDLYINNHASAFFSPNTLDFSTPTLNQQFRVDIITTSADPFSVSVGDVLMNLYQTQPGNPLVSGYLTIGADLTSLFASHLGQTLRLRFVEVDNVSFFNAGIDRVSITIPEPGTAALALGGLSFFVADFIRRRRRQQRQR